MKYLIFYGSHPKIFGYAENIVPTLSLDDFKSHFRLQRSSVEKLVAMLSRDAHFSMGRPEIELGKQVLVLLWCLANLECFRSIADRFGMSNSTACRIVHRTAVAVMGHAAAFVTWPQGDDARRTIEGFRTNAGFPGTIGAIDGYHIEIKAPKKDHLSYINRKGVHSVILQAICDGEAKFLHCTAGEAGSVHDARVYRRSDFFTNISAETFPFGSHLVGDAAYPLSENLMTPYRNTGNLTPQHVKYNKKHAKTRVAIERAFGLSKGRFRRLLYLETRKPDIIVSLITCACILHNACLMWGDDFEVATVDEVPDSAGELYEGSERSGVAKRNYIKSIL
ncbi:putative nuclease HARBI1 [Ornithodoros turicata]|uniref:putative nuclease HARBI1 n=1 Tax=Ornithodoros turicata TaxID=34597 RepID=UPI0031392959